MSSLIDRIRDAVIGRQCSIATPFGEKPLVYADYTASGRSLTFIEDYIRNDVLPFYANTHTETAFTGARTTALREAARSTIRDAVNAGAEDSVIFCGSGATAAINKIIDIMNLRLPADLADRYALAQGIPQEDRPVVFIGPYEHHSNELPWRESLCTVEVIPLDAAGGIDQACLAAALQKYAARKRKIGSFSAASNVTGIKSDVTGITRLLKEHGALAFWDYAAAGPYVAIDMNGADPLDAIFLSPHKFVGGPGTPGVLVAKNALFQNRVPATVGGGTVSWVNATGHVYARDIERREEGGTPAIVESIRAGLVFSLQQAVGTDTIAAREADLAARALARFRNCANLEVLGPSSAARLPIFSLRFRHGQRDLHHGFVVALLNDLFGIQVRGGCSCAGPYAHSLLGIDSERSQQFETAITNGDSLMRPGWVRVNFNYFIDEAELEYLLRAFELVAEHGWRMLPQYAWHASHGVWRHHRAQQQTPPPFTGLSWLNTQPRPPETAARPLDTHLQQAERLLQEPLANPTAAPLILSDSNEALRWFVLPQEIQPGERRSRWNTASEA